MEKPDDLLEQLNYLHFEWVGDKSITYEVGNVRTGSYKRQKILSRVAFA